MFREIRLLTILSLRNVWGINQVRFGRDRKKRNRLMLLLAAYGILGLMLGLYMGMGCYGCVMLGMGEVIPALVLTAASALIFFFTVFTAGKVLFDEGTYERLIVLPVRPSSIVISRFLKMYLLNIGICLVVMLPAAGVYGICLHPGVGFYLGMALGVLLLPFLPITAASIIGAIVIAVSSRMKHRNLVSVVLMMALTVGYIVLVSGNGAAMEEMTLTTEQLAQVAETAKQQINSLYPPAAWFQAGVLEGDVASWICFLLISVVPFTGMVAVVQRYFQAISARLHARQTRGNYKLETLSVGSLTSALYKKELKRYFSCGIYVMNTLIGYVLMVVLAIGICVTGTEQMEGMLGLPGLINRALPLVMGMLCGISTTTTSAISIEGRQWWLLNSLPITTKQILDSKMLVNLTVGLPSMLLADIFLILSVETDVWGYVWMIAVPITYLLLFSVLGITINLKMPLFQWESEAEVVKQSTAVLVSMLTGMGLGLIPMVLVLVLPRNLTDLIMAAVMFLLLTLTILLYRRNGRVDLKKI